MEEERKKEIKISVKDWIKINTVIFGAILTVFALIWQAKPDNGIIMVSFLLLISFPFFINSINANARLNKEIDSENVSKNYVKRLELFAELTFGGGFTLVICALTVLGYEYLKDYTNRDFIAFMFPIIFLSVVWSILIGYTIIDNTDRPFQFKKFTKRFIWILIEMLFLFLIILDYIGIYLIQ
ncbi:MAG: hypothetical protein ACFFA8_07405 [Promethearchaeota archaeon]